MKQGICVRVNNYVEAMGVRKIMEMDGGIVMYGDWHPDDFGDGGQTRYIELDKGYTICRRSSRPGAGEQLPIESFWLSTRTITIDGKDIEISEESYQALKEQLT